MCRHVDFYEIAKECYNDRIREEKFMAYDMKNKAQTEYAMFCCWCRAFRNSNFTEKNFKEYQRVENVKLDFWTKKEIAEQYFGYKFEFDNNSHKWKLCKQ